MKQRLNPTQSHRWTRPQPHIPATRRGLEPLVPTYIPASPKKDQNR